MAKEDNDYVLNKDVLVPTLFSSNVDNILLDTHLMLKKGTKVKSMIDRKNIYKVLEGEHMGTLFKLKPSLLNPVQEKSLGDALSNIIINVAVAVLTLVAAILVLSSEKFEPVIVITFVIIISWFFILRQRK